MGRGEDAYRTRGRDPARSGSRDGGGKRGAGRLVSLVFVRTIQPDPTRTAATLRMTHSIVSETSEKERRGVFLVPPDARSASSHLSRDRTRARRASPPSPRLRRPRLPPLRHPRVASARNRARVSSPPGIRLPPASPGFLLPVRLGEGGSSCSPRNGTDFSMDPSRRTFSLRSMQHWCRLSMSSPKMKSMSCSFSSTVMAQGIGTPRRL